MRTAFTVPGISPLAPLAPAGRRSAAAPAPVTATAAGDPERRHDAPPRDSSSARDDRSRRFAQAKALALAIRRFGPELLALCASPLPLTRPSARPVASGDGNTSPHIDALA